VGLHKSSDSIGEVKAAEHEHVFGSGYRARAMSLSGVLFQALPFDLTLSRVPTVSPAISRAHPSVASAPRQFDSESELLQAAEDKASTKFSNYSTGYSVTEMRLVTFSIQCHHSSTVGDCQA